MIDNPELVKQLLGEQVAELFDGTITIEPSNGEKIGNFSLGDKITFKFKHDGPVRQFVVTDIK